LFLLSATLVHINKILPFETPKNRSTHQTPKYLRGQHPKYYSLIKNLKHLEKEREEKAFSKEGKHRCIIIFLKKLKNFFIPEKFNL
jgi:hypothetical protein